MPQVLPKVVRQYSYVDACNLFLIIFLKILNCVTMYLIITKGIMMKIWKNLWKPVSTKFASRGIKSFYYFLKIKKKLKSSYISVKFFFQG